MNADRFRVTDLNDAFAASPSCPNFELHKVIIE